MQALITTLNIDSSAIQEWIPKLDNIRRSAFPNATRKTLNDVALDIKQVTMPIQELKHFKQRQPTFWGATSRVEFAKGFNVNEMAAIVGFVPPTNAKEKGYATTDLEEQEDGGAIDKRAFIPTNAGRTSLGNVRQALRISKIKNYIVDANEEMGKNSPEKFIRAAMKVGYGGGGAGGFVIGTGTNSHGNRALLQIISIHRLRRDESKPGYKAGNMVVKSKEIYSVKAHRKAHVKATHFMEDAAIESSGLFMERMFVRHSIEEINKVRK